MRATTRPLRVVLAVVAAVTLVVGSASCGSDEAADVASDRSTTEAPGATGDPDAPVSSPSSGGASPGGVTGPPADLSPIPRTDAEVLVGLAIDDAEDVADERGWTVRVARRDGEDLALTDDYSPTRVNVAVEGDVVAAVVSVG